MKKLLLTAILIFSTELSIQATSRDDQERWQDKLNNDTIRDKIEDTNSRIIEISSCIITLGKNPTTSNLRTIEVYINMTNILKSMKEKLKKGTPITQFSKIEMQTIEDFNNAAIFYNIRQQINAAIKETVN